MPRCNDSNRDDLLKFLFEQPFNEEVIKMDCNDGCEELSRLAERVVAGETVESIMPELQEHMKYWKDCREEFDALVAVLRAEREGNMPSDDLTPGAE